MATCSTPNLLVVQLPELVPQIARHLTPHDLTQCIRVSRVWFEAYIVVLYEEVTTFDFDHAKRTDQQDQVHRYGHLVKRITTAFVQNVIFLGPRCTNLTHVSVVYMNPQKHFRVTPSTKGELGKWIQLRRETCSSETMAQMWVELIARNPGLRVIEMDNQQLDTNMEIVAQALGTLQNLDELHLYDLSRHNDLELLLRHCHRIRLLSWNPSSYSAIQLFEVQNLAQGPSNMEDGAMVAKETRSKLAPWIRTTQIRYLEISRHNSRHSHIVAWFDYLLRLCPELDRLAFPLFATGALFPEIALIITARCPKIQRLDFRSLRPEYFDQPQNEALGRLLNDSPRLRIISLGEFTTGFSAKHHVKDYPGLRERLEEFLGGESLLPRRSSGMFGVLELCPRLRVFAVGSVVLPVDEFLQVQWACRDSLKRLRIIVQGHSTNSTGDVVQRKEPDAGDGSGDHNDQCPDDSRDEITLEARMMEHLVELEVLEELTLDYVVFNGRKFEPWPWTLDVQSLQRIKLKALRVFYVNGIRIKCA